MHPKTGLSLALSLLLLSLLACTWIPGPASPAPEDTIATSVAATLAAGGPGPSPSPGGSAETAPSPTDAPVETPTPEPAHLQVAYVSDGDLWLWSEGAAPVSLTSLGDVSSVRISDDGQRLAFTRRVDPLHQEIRAVNSDGSNTRTLVSSADFESLAVDSEAVATYPASLDWVPGSHLLTFNTYPAYEGPGYFLANDLHQVDADSGTLNTLLAPGLGGEFQYAPDGSQMALVKPDQISLLNPDGTGRLDLLSFPLIYTYSEYALYPQPVWLPDSSAVRVIIPPQDPLGDPSAETTLWHLPADGSAPTALLNFLTVPFFASPAQLSPDGAQLAYQVPIGAPADNTSELHLRAADGSGDTIYATGQLNFEAWSPDGSRFIYTGSGGSSPQIGQLGSPPQPLSGTSLVRNVRWIDNRQFLYLNRAGSSWELWLGSIDAPAQLLASSSGNDLISYDFTR